MSKPKWTKGPWNCEIFPGLIVEEKTEETVCSMFDIMEDDCKNAENNKYLIAAAPQLYDALKECLEVFKACKEEIDTYHHWDLDMAEDAMKMAEAALKAAEGEK
jgi:hypothetical protein